MIDLHTLEPGRPTALEVAERAAAFLGGAPRSLDLALYDVRLPGEAGDIVADALRDAARRGVAVRVAYNADHDERVFPPPPRTKPELLERLPFPTLGIPGIPDLMHHKYVVRDGEAVWTGSANWTTDSWTVQDTILGSVLQHAEFKGKPSTRWTPESIHDFMHAKVTVADDHVFAGSFNLSRSGEQNAENVLELHHPELADRLAAFIDGIRERYDRMPPPDATPAGGPSPDASAGAPPPDTTPAGARSPDARPAGAPGGEPQTGGSPAPPPGRL